MDVRPKFGRTFVLSAPLREAFASSRLKKGPEAPPSGSRREAREGGAEGGREAAAGARLARGGAAARGAPEEQKHRCHYRKA